MRWPALGLAPLALVLLVPVALAGNEDDQTAEEEMSQTEMESRVRADLARRLGVETDTIRVLEAEERTWPSQLLGCHARRALGDPVPVPGYRIVLGVGEERHIYHTDRRGRFVRCEKPKKPVDRIQ